MIQGLEVGVIPNGSDITHFRHFPRNAALAESLSLISEGKDHGTAGVIGFAGEAREKKGLQPLLNAYAQINKKDPATLFIVGDIRARVIVKG